MPKLTKASKKVAQELLAWDVTRVAAIHARGVDVSVYRRRQKLAMTTLAADLPTKDWPREILDIFMAVLEVHMMPQPVKQYGVGPLKHSIPQRTDDERRALKTLAKQLGVIENLRVVAPDQWREEAV